MAIREVLRYPDPRLRLESVSVTAVTNEVRTLIEDMAETMYAARGVGLAAPQIGENVRIFVIDIGKLQVFINPVLVRSGAKVASNEGCLSFPGIFEEVSRSEQVKVSALNADGVEFELTADGLLAMAIQHENDHLDGVLLVDKVSKAKKMTIGARMRPKR